MGANNNIQWATSNPLSVQCNLDGCLTMFTRHVDMLRHQRELHQEPKKCPWCSYKSKRDGRMWKHMEEEHTPPRSHQNVGDDEHTAPATVSPPAYTAAYNPTNATPDVPEQSKSQAPAPYVAAQRMTSNTNRGLDQHGSSQASLHFNVSSELLENGMRLDSVSTVDWRGYATSSTATDAVLGMWSRGPQSSTTEMRQVPTHEAQMIGTNCTGAPIPSNGIHYGFSYPGQSGILRPASSFYSLPPQINRAPTLSAGMHEPSSAGNIVIKVTETLPNTPAASSFVNSESNSQAPVGSPVQQGFQAWFPTQNQNQPLFQDQSSGFIAIPSTLCQEPGSTNPDNPLKRVQVPAQDQQSNKSLASMQNRVSPQDMVSQRPLPGRFAPYSHQQKDVTRTRRRKTPSD